MFTFVFTVLDVLLIVGIFLAITRFIRVIFKRVKCIATLKKICKKKRRKQQVLPPSSFYYVML